MCCQEAMTHIRSKTATSATKSVLVVDDEVRERPTDSICFV
jgi:hypothetical protein